LRTIAQSTRHLIVSAISNLVSRLTPDGTEATLRLELTNLFEDVLDCLVQMLNCNPNLQVTLISLII
jgi:hypothetical protein